MLLNLAAALVLAQAATSLTTLDPRWVIALETPAAAAAAYDAVHAYVPLRGGAVLAVDLDRGVIAWRREIATTVQPATGGGLVFVAADGLVEAVAAATGETRWRTPIPGRLTAVHWDNGWLLCATEAGDLAALRATDGTLVWRTAMGGAMVAPPAAALDYLYVAVEGARVLALDLATGHQVWERTLTGRLTALSSTADQLVVGSTGREVVSLDLVTGRVRWRWRVGGDVIGQATSDADHIYFVARDNVVRAVDRGNGNLRWYAELDARPVGGPSLFEDTLLVPMATTVAVLNPATGAHVAAVAAAGEISTAPYLRLDARPTGARLVAMTRDGRLQGFGVRYEPPLELLQALPGTPVVP